MIFSISSPVEIHAEATNVKDCIEAGDCLDDDKEEGLQPSESKAENNTKTGSLAKSMVKMFFALAFILLLIFVIVRLLNKRNRQISETNVIENLGGITVGTNKSIQIIRVGSKMYLIGVGESVDLLKEITEEDVVDRLLDHSESKAVETPDLLAPFLSKIKKKETKGETPSFDRLFKNELETMKENRRKIMEQEEKGDGRE